MNAKKIAKVLLFICVVLTLGIFGLLKFLDIKPNIEISRDR